MQGEMTIFDLLRRIDEIGNGLRAISESQLGPKAHAEVGVLHELEKFTRWDPVEGPPAKEFDNFPGLRRGEGVFSREGVDAPRGVGLPALHKVCDVESAIVSELHVGHCRAPVELAGIHHP